MNDPLRRVLFISYAYPPTGGGGVQRSVKFVKYLPEFGWRPTILTAANPSVPVRDHDLSDELDPETTILRARTLEPSYAVKQKLVSTGKRSRLSIRGLARRAGMSLLQPDPQVLWNPFADRMAKTALRQTPHEVIYVTGPPFSSFLLGRSLKRRFGLPLVLDFRDEWLLSSQYLDNHQRSGLAFRRQLAMLRKVLRAADAVLTTTQASACELARHIEQSGSRASVQCIYNGYDDEDDLVPIALVPIAPSPDTDVARQDHGASGESPQPSRLRIVYTGTLWTLTDVSPVVSAMLHLAAADPQTASRVDLIFAGRRTPDQDAVLRRLDNTPIRMQSHDYLPHGQSISLAKSADVLLLLLADQPGAERVVPAKLFEYMAVNKPILAVCGEGETASLLRQHGHRNVFHPNQSEQVSKWLASRLRGEPGRIVHDASAIGQFARRELTRQLASVFAGIVK